MLVEVEVVGEIIKDKVELIEDLFGYFIGIHSLAPNNKTGSL